MNAIDQKLAQRASELAKDIKAMTEQERWENLPDDVFQELFASMVRAYSVQSQARSASEEGTLAPFIKGKDVTATDIVITAAAMLRVEDIAAFELAMWHY